MAITCIRSKDILYKVGMLTEGSDPNTVTVAACWWMQIQYVHIIHVYMYIFTTDYRKLFVHIQCIYTYTTEWQRKRVCTISVSYEDIL